MNALMNWSGGKDSSLALYHVLNEGNFNIDYLLTSINEKYQRISMHGVREELLQQQAKSIGLPLRKLIIPEMPSMEDYNRIMHKELKHAQSQGITHSIFGDIFLEDLRKYREDKLQEVGLKGVFPLWQQDTRALIMEFLNLGFRTVVTCVNDKYLNQSFVGREIDVDFINDLPDNVDPCGENGEFHTFVFDGPIFQHKIQFDLGEKVHRRYNPTNESEDDNCVSDNNAPFSNGFWYCDLIPKEN